MDVKIENADIVLSECGDALYISGLEQLKQQIKIACSIKKGSFVYDREMGTIFDNIDKDDPLISQKLEMLFKEATISLGYCDLCVSRVRKYTDRIVAKLEVFYKDKKDTLEVTING